MGVMQLLLFKDGVSIGMREGTAAAEDTKTCPS
jgi:hypothetical protein